MSVNLRNLLIGAGVAAVGGIGIKLASDYLRNRGQEQQVEGESVTDQPEQQAIQQVPAGALSASQVAYVNVEPSSVQGFLDKSFGSPGRYTPTRPPKVFEYQGQQYMVIWARDNQKNKNQMLAFIYKDSGRSMVASVGYTGDASDYNINLESTPLAVEINGKQIKSGKGNAEGTDEVDLVVAA
ncbi:hypothetical protein [Kamptonema formosum]|uniref:hypothetical protein n=1 Tax=Kamptonema formosum TaxID=331992 RepID=UPI0003452683|nr:hypothetical protein [Oscillatoria sp. PCC 10802]